MPQMEGLGATPVRLLVTLHRQPGTGMDGWINGWTEWGSRETIGVLRRDLLSWRNQTVECLPTVLGLVHISVWKVLFGIVAKES